MRNDKRLCKTRDFVQDQSLSDFGTAASRMLSGFEDFEVAKMKILGKRTVLHSILIMKQFLDLLLFGLVYVLLYSECTANEDITEANDVMDQVKDTILKTQKS